MLGIIPAAGSASRMQPLGGSKELLPLGPSGNGAGARLRVVSEYLVERMLLAGADRIGFVISGEKADLLRFYARSGVAARLFFVTQPRPAGLCDAVFRAAAFAGAAEPVLIGLPDTVWHPRAAFIHGLRAGVHLITFPAPNPEEFDAVIPAEGTPGQVARIEVKAPGDARRRVWGAVTAPGGELRALEKFWRQRGWRDQYLGDLLNAWMLAGHPVTCDRQGTAYWDIGTPDGYSRALQARAWEEPAPAAYPDGGERGTSVPRMGPSSGPSISLPG